MRVLRQLIRLYSLQRKTEQVPDKKDKKDKKACIAFALGTYLMKNM